MSKPLTHNGTCPQCEGNGHRVNATILSEGENSVGWCENGHVFIDDSREDKAFLAYNFAR